MSERVDITTLATIEKIELIVIGLLDHNRHNFQISNTRQSGHADPFKNQPLARIDSHSDCTTDDTSVWRALQNRSPYYSRVYTLCPIHLQLRSYRPKKNPSSFYLPNLFSLQ